MNLLKLIACAMNNHERTTVVYREIQITSKGNSQPEYSEARRICVDCEQVLSQAYLLQESA